MLLSVQIPNEKVLFSRRFFFPIHKSDICFCFSMDLYAEVIETLPEEVENEKVEIDEVSVIKDSSMTESVESRLKRRAKRPSKYLVKCIKDATMAPNGLVSSPNHGSGRLAKNMRRPRNGFGRGLAKKGGYLFLFQKLTCLLRIVNGARVFKYQFPAIHSVLWLKLPFVFYHNYILNILKVMHNLN